MSKAPQCHGRRAALRAPFLLFAAVSLAGCSADATTDPAVNIPPAALRSITVRPDTATRTIGQSLHFQAVVQDTQGAVIADSRVTWQSSDTSIVVVDSAGVATTRATGTASIVAVVGGDRDSAIVTVVAPPVSSIDVTPADAHATVGDTQRFIAAVKDTTGNVVTGRRVAWATSDTNVATIGPAGLVRAVGAGPVSITASVDDKTGHASLTVSDSFVPVAHVGVAPATANAVVGDSARFTAVVSDANGKTLANRVVTWSSSSPATATVGASGVALALQPGSATVTATSEGKSGPATLTVTPVPVASVQIQPATVSLVVGDTARLAATTRDAHNQILTGRQVTWASGNAAIATVSANGTAKAIQAGSTTISAMSEGQTGQASISVATPPPVIASVAVTPATATLVVGTSQQLAATVKDTSGNVLTGQAVTWSSSDTTVVTMSAGGLARARSVGSATVTGVVGGKSGTAVVTAQFGAPASVSVSPATTGLGVGQVQQFTAVVRDVAGNVLSGQSVTWGTSAPLVSSVLAGLATALVPGSATITAASGAASGAASVTVSLLPPPPSPWTNAPASDTTIVDQPFDDAGSRGWSVIWNDLAYGANALDVGAPFSPSGVWQVTYPIGFTGGTAPATVVYDMPAQRHFYSGTYWKASSPWQGHSSNVNKIQFAFLGTEAVMLEFYGPPGGPFEMHAVTELVNDNRRLPPNVQNVPVTMGQWHKLEWLVDLDAHRVAWWMDGTLIGDYRDVQFGGTGVTEYKISPTWGGIGDAKTETDYYWYDHVILKGY